MTKSFWNLVNEFKITIPLIQRDYAQGRETGKVPKIRGKFIDALYNALQNDGEKLELDFIYGYTKQSENKGFSEEKSFIPLDGQQRLTTLFLLHWYIAGKEGVLVDNIKNLKKFSYETRHSSNVFCDKLVEFTPEFNRNTLGEEITDKPWFFTAWNNDPTISSMLVVLNSIHEKFKYSDNIWPKLVSEDTQISFHLLPMDDLGLPDDLYIKMNSRGKELTDFEYFKSQFSELIPSQYVEEFKNNVDQKWSDLFWDLYKNQEGHDLAKLSDRAFLRFYDYVTDMLIFRNNIEKSDVNNGLINEDVYCDELNCKFLFDALNSLCNNLENFQDIFYINQDDYSDDKVRLFFQNANVNLFKLCAQLYDSDSRNNPFSIGEQILFYGYLQHIIHKTEDFKRRIRIVRNLVNNSEDTVRRENLQGLLQDVEEIVFNGIINPETKFNTRQLNEENEKQIYLADNPSFKNALHLAEDHKLLQGALSILNFDSTLPHYSVQFRNLFNENCKYKEISIALLTLGDYSQLYSWRRRVGNGNDSSWRELLTLSNRRQGFENTKSILFQLMGILNANPSLSLSEIESQYLKSFVEDTNKPKDWQYYYIKYNLFDINWDGYLYWPNPTLKLDYKVMRRTSLGGFHWSPYLYVIKTHFGNKVNLENYGAPLIVTKNKTSFRMRSCTEGFCFESTENARSEQIIQKMIEMQMLDNLGILHIQKLDENHDIDDRVLKGTEFLDLYFNSELNVNQAVELGESNMNDTIE